MQYFEAYRGWLIAPSPTDGTYVPFFVRVRAKDIEWDSESIDFPKEISGLIPEDRKNVEMTAPVALVRFQYASWYLTLYTDYTYTATKRINVGKDGFSFVEPGDRSEIHLSAALPLLTLNDDHLSIHLSKAAKNRDITTAFDNCELVIGTNDDGDSYVTGIDLHLVNTICGFDDEFVTNKAYDTSELYITIDGKMFIEKGE